jgi:hypothetical protein
VVEKALEPIPEEAAQIQHFILHRNFLMVASHRSRRRKAAWYGLSDVVRLRVIRFPEREEM